MDLLKEKTTQSLLEKYIKSIECWGFIAFDDMIQLEVDLTKRRINFVGKILTKKSKVSNNQAERQQAVKSYVKGLLGQEWEATFENKHGRIGKNNLSKKSSNRKRARSVRKGGRRG